MVRKVLVTVALVVVVLLAIGGGFVYLAAVIDRLRAKGVRAEIDLSSDRMPKKIRNATLQKVPFQLIAGEEDRAANAVSFRFRDGHQENGAPVDEAQERVFRRFVLGLLVFWMVAVAGFLWGLG